jgi:fibronectin type 3 domain-containing protein
MTPPAAPSGLAATAGDGSVGLDWNDNGEGDLDGYNVYRSTTSGSGYSQINGSLVSYSNYTDNTVTNGTTYYYVVTAVDTLSNESAYSVEDSATPSDTTAPAAPTNLSATAGDSTVSLDWDDNSEGDLDGYNVYRSTTSGSGYTQINGSLVGSSDYTDNSVTNGTTYYYVVTAVDTSSNESGYSSEDSATPSDTTAPAAPTSLAATAGDGSVSLDWNDNGEGDLDGYNVYRSTTSGSGYSQINGSLVGSSDYTDNTVTNGITYYYVVTAVDTASNESGYSNEESATPNIGGGEVSILGSWVTGTSHTKESGTNRAFVVIAHAEGSWWGNPTLDTVTYGGQTMTKITDVVEGGRWRTRAFVAAFILDEAGVAAASGSDINASWGGYPSSTSLTSVFLENVNQSNLVGDYETAGVTNSGTITTSALSTSDGDMVIEGGSCTETGTYTTNNGFTEDIELSSGSFDGMDGHKSATGADETPSVTHSTSTNRQVLLGFVVRQ